MNEEKEEVKKYSIDIIGAKLQLSVTVHDEEDLNLVKKFVNEYITKKLA